RPVAVGDVRSAGSCRGRRKRSWAAHRRPLSRVLKAAVATFVLPHRLVGRRPADLKGQTTSGNSRTVTAVSGSGPYTETLSSPLSFRHAAGAAVTGAHSGSATATYQEPIPAGNGSCGSSTTSGTAIVNWGDNSTTVVGFNTAGAAAAVNLTGSVIPS